MAINSLPVVIHHETLGRIEVPQTTDPNAQRTFQEATGTDLGQMPALWDFEHLISGVRFLDQKQVHSFESGCAEPWVAQLLSAMLVASGQRVVLETGTFTGTTAAWLCLTLARSGGGEFIGCEIDPERAATAQARLEELQLPDTVRWRILQGDVLETLQTIPDESLGFVWVDDDHTHEHVDAELNALFPKMTPGGIICGHDVHGSCDLQQEFKRYGGIALDLPRLGPAGGIGIIQL